MVARATEPRMVIRPEPRRARWAQSRSNGSTLGSPLWPGARPVRPRRRGHHLPRRRSARVGVTSRKVDGPIRRGSGRCPCRSSPGRHRGRCGSRSQSHGGSGAADRAVPSHRPVEAATSRRRSCTSCSLTLAPLARTVVAHTLAEPSPFTSVLARWRPHRAGLDEVVDPQRSSIWTWELSLLDQ